MEGLQAFLEHRSKLQLLLALVKICSRGMGCSPWRQLLTCLSCCSPVAASGPSVPVGVA